MTLRFQIVILISTAILFFTGCSDFFSSDKTSNSTQTPSAPSGQSLPEDLLHPNEGEFSEKKLLANLGLNVFAKQAQNLAVQVPALKYSIEAYCTALESGEEAVPQKSDVVRDWQRVMIALHTIEGAPFGPYINRGRFIADYLYSWPFLNTCGIDQNVYSWFHQQKPKAQELFYNLRGLAAIEYLLFEDSLMSRCNIVAQPQMQQWNNQTTAQKKRQRCEWSLQLMTDIDEKAKILYSDWSTSGGHYTAQMVSAQIFTNEKEALNAITDALSNIEKLKDLKLGRPLGRHKDCDDVSCAKDVEHIYSGFSLQAGEAQLLGFKAIFFGSSSSSAKAFGFDDMLIQHGRQDVVTRMDLALDKAIASIKNAQNNGHLKDQIENMNPMDCKESTSDRRLVEICAVHADIRDVAFIFKTEVLTALSLRAPPLQQGDND